MIEVAGVFGGVPICVSEIHFHIAPDNHPKLNQKEELLCVKMGSPEVDLPTVATRLPGVVSCKACLEWIHA